MNFILPKIHSPTRPLTLLSFAPTTHPTFYVYTHSRFSTSHPPPPRVPPSAKTYPSNTPPPHSHPNAPHFSTVNSHSFNPNNNPKSPISSTNVNTKSKVPPISPSPANFPTESTSKSYYTSSSYQKIVSFQTTTIDTPPLNHSPPSPHTTTPFSSTPLTDVQLDSVSSPLPPQPLPEAYGGPDDVGLTNAIPPIDEIDPNTTETGMLLEDFINLPDEMVPKSSATPNSINPLGVESVNFTTTSPVGVSLPPITLGDVVEFYDDGKPRYGRVAGFVSARLFNVDTQDGSPTGISSGAVSFRFPKAFSLFSGQSIASIPNIIEQKIQALAEKGTRFSKQQVWDHFSKRGILYITPADALPLFFGDTPDPGLTILHEGNIVPIFHLYATQYILMRSKYLFSVRDAGVFGCRSPKKVQYLREEQKALENSTYVAQFLQAAERALATNPEFIKRHFVAPKKSPRRVDQPQGGVVCTEWDVRKYPYCTNAIQRLAVTNGRISLLDETVCELLLAPLGYSTMDANYLLTQLGIWKQTENHLRVRAEIDWEVLDPYPPQISKAATNLQHTSTDSDKDLKTRLDLRNMRVFTIDSPTTVEIDDGLSVEFREDGSEWIHVHISDPTRWLEPSSELDLFARRKISSIYMPELVSHLFPLDLSRDYMSILPGTVSHALTFSACLAEDGAIKEYKISPSLIQKTQRTNYDEVNELVANGESPVFDPEANFIVHRLYEWALKRSRYRVGLGAMIFTFPKAAVYVTDPEEISVSLERSGDSPSQILVSEMMVLGGEIAGRYAVKHLIPVPFRFQDPIEYPSLEYKEYIEKLPPVAKEFVLMNVRSLANYSTSVMLHDGMGLKGYTRATSPLRRYGDLIVHWQIKAHLRGETLPFTGEQVDNIVKHMWRVEHELKKLQRDSISFWLLQHLKNTQIGVEQAGVIVDITKAKATFILPTFGLRGRIKLADEHQLKLGDTVWVKIRKIDGPHVHFDWPDEGNSNQGEESAVLSLVLEPEPVE